MYSNVVAVGLRPAPLLLFTLSTANAVSQASPSLSIDAETKHFDRVRVQPASCFDGDRASPNAATAMMGQARPGASSIQEPNTVIDCGGGHHRLPAGPEVSHPRGAAARGAAERTEDVGGGDSSAAAALSGQSGGTESTIPVSPVSSVSPDPAGTSSGRGEDHRASEPTPGHDSKWSGPWQQEVEPNASPHAVRILITVLFTCASAVGLLATCINHRWLRRRLRPRVNALRHDPRAKTLLAVFARTSAAFAACASTIARLLTTPLAAVFSAAVSRVFARTSAALAACASTIARLLTAPLAAVFSAAASHVTLICRDTPAPALTPAPASMSATKKQRRQLRRQRQPAVSAPAPTPALGYGPALASAPAAAPSSPVFHAASACVQLEGESPLSRSARLQQQQLRRYGFLSQPCRPRRTGAGGGGVQHPPCQGPQDPRWLRRLLARSSLLPRLPCCLRACSPQRPRSPRCLLIRRYLERPPCRDPRWPRRLLAHSPLLLRLPRRLHTCSPRHPRSPRRLLIRRYLERVSRSRYSASGGRCPGWSCCGGYSRQSAPR